MASGVIKYLNTAARTRNERKKPPAERVDLVLFTESAHAQCGVPRNEFRNALRLCIANMAASVTMRRSKVLFVVDFNRCINSPSYVGAGSCNKSSWWRRVRNCRFVCTSRATVLAAAASPPPPPMRASAGDCGAAAGNSSGEVIMEFYRGLRQVMVTVTVPLPSHKERCRFTLKSVSHTVGDFFAMLRREDDYINHVAVSSLDGVRMASSNTIQALVEDDFKLMINDNEYIVCAPRQERFPKDEYQRLSEVRNLVYQLYEALNVEEHQLNKERQLCRKLKELEVELEPVKSERAREEAPSRNNNFLGESLEISIPFWSSINSL